MKSRKKPKDLEGPEEDEGEDDLIKSIKFKNKSQTQIVLGDIAITSTASPKLCKSLLKDLLGDKQIKSYLDLRKKKIISQIPLGVG